MAESEDKDARRHPLNMEGILRFCIENTKNEDAQNPTQFQEMSEERKKWLAEALASVGESAINPVKQMVECIRVLTEPDSQVEGAAKEKALDDLCILTEDVDLANDFHKVGGYALLELLLNHPDAQMRKGGATLIAHIAQNNPYSQDKLLENQFLHKVMEKLKSSESQPNQPDSVKIKLLYAVSCMVRSHAPCQEAFVSLDGFSMLLRAMQSTNMTMQLKGAFLLCALCEEEPKHKDTICNMGLVEQLASLLQADQSSINEHLLRALLLLATDNKRAQEECRRPELNLAKILRGKMETLKDMDECQEEVEYSQQLYSICFGSLSGATSAVDR